MLDISCIVQSNTETERKVGDPCQDCEALLDYQLLKILPQSVDTLPRFHENKPQIKITGAERKIPRTFII